MSKVRCLRSWSASCTLTQATCQNQQQHANCQSLRCIAAICRHLALVTRVYDDAVYVLRVAQHAAPQQHLRCAAPPYERLCVPPASRRCVDAALSGASLVPTCLICSQAEGVCRQLQVACERVQRVVGRLTLDLRPELAQRRLGVKLPPVTASLSSACIACEGSRSDDVRQGKTHGAASAIGRSN